jgi:hypothetical protein
MGCQGSKATKAPKSENQVSFEVCGKVGAVVNYASGNIDEVLANSQAERLGVQKGWQVILVDDEPYTRQCLEEKVTMETPFRLTFLKAAAVPATSLQQEPASATLLQEPAGESTALKKEPEGAEESLAAGKHETQESQEATSKKEGNADGMPAVDASATARAKMESKENANADGEPSAALSVTEGTQLETVGECVLPVAETAAAAAKAEESCEPEAVERIMDEIAPEAQVVEETLPEVEAVEAKAPWKCIFARCS